MHSRPLMNSNLVEFLRFGSSIPGGYWGCCAGDIIQAFKTLPSEESSCQAVNGDNEYPMKNDKGEFLFFGPDNETLFKQRLRVGTFGGGDMPNHFFFIALERHQLQGAMGKAWLPILKEMGFEFIRKVNNSVWNKDNFIFGLIRNCGPNAVDDQFTPPPEWTSLPSNGKTEMWELVAQHFEGGCKALTKQYKDVDKPIFAALPGSDTMLTEAELREKGVPVILAGKRSEFPQEHKDVREAYIASQQPKEPKKKEISLRAGNAMPVAKFPA